MSEVLAALIGAAATAILTPLCLRLFRKFSGYVSDRDAVVSWMIAFQRPAFRGRYAGRRTDFRELLRAIEETTRALDTGNMQAVGSTAPAKSIVQLRKRRWKDTCQQVVGLLGEIRNELNNIITDEPGVDVQQSVAEIDKLRDRVIELMNTIWREAGKGELYLPTQLDYRSE
jgi:hypothetical protein